MYDSLWIQEKAAASKALGSAERRKRRGIRVKMGKKSKVNGTKTSSPGLAEPMSTEEHSDSEHDSLAEILSPDGII